MRAWAEKLGLNGHSALHAIITDKRKTPKKYIPLFIKNLSLDTQEGLYFETLVDIQRARNIDEKELYLQRLKTLSPRKEIRMLEVESYKHLKNPLHAILIEMTALKGFQPNTEWI